MVQKEVKKKAQAYGLMAILLASVCVAIIYTAGTGTLTSPGPSPQPSANPTNPPTNGDNSMRTFSSYDELKNFLTNNGTTNNQANWNYGMLGGSETFSRTQNMAPVAAPTADTAKGFSQTNIQVSGVDEADKVKTDGNYLYTVANNTVYIIDANPSTARVVQKIPFVNASILGLYLSQDGNKLVVLGDNYMYYSYAYSIDPPKGVDIMIYPYIRSGTTFACVYDVSNKNVAPVLARNLTMSGNYLNSRVIGNYLYNIITEYAYTVNNDTVLLPAVYKGAEATNIPATNVYYNNVNDSYGTSYSSYSFTTFLAIDLNNAAASPKNMTVMLSGSEQVYVSPTNIYLTYPVYEWNNLAIDIVKTPPIAGIQQPVPTSSGTFSIDSLKTPPIVATRQPEPTSSGNVSSSTAPIIVPNVPAIWRPSTAKTTVYRIHIAGDSIAFAAQGNVTGTIVGQYSMDESNGYFRCATNAWVYDEATGFGTQQNYVFVLDMNMNVVGKLENIASGENFHSARFMGNRCYMVTFMSTDPLFVIDLSQPSNPTILGNLTIPGYSDYLHPYDETHLIGLGKDTVTTDNNGFAWYQGLKLSLFDVSDVTAPTEVDKFIIGDRGTDSDALRDPKAFLFDKSKNLLVIPVNLYLVNPNYTDYGFPEKMVPPTTATPSKEPETNTPSAQPTPGFSSPSAYGQFVWQGVYVFKVTAGGFELRGNITQVDNALTWFNDPSNPMRNSYSFINYNQFISRAVYIDNVLYTFSDSRVQLNSLDSLALIAKIDLD
jgi:inhibitor of cysteine peptidase